jgi:hypothetical protein
MSDSKVNTEKLVAILDKLFIVPESSMNRLTIAGLTDRQAQAMILFGQGRSISNIAKEITNGSPFTQNAYDALGVGISKVFEALVLVKELSENKDLVSEILKRGLNYKRRFELEYK